MIVRSVKCEKCGLISWFVRPHEPERCPKCGNSRVPPKKTKIMKRLRMNPKVQLKIVNEYKEKLPNGNYRFTLKDIADNNGLDVYTVNNILAQVGVRGMRGNGRWKKLDVPSPRILKILRDYSEPGATLKQVGEINARMVNGRPEPLTKQRVQQIVARWQPKSPVKRKFAPGDLIEWNNRRFRIVRYYNSRKGAVHELDESNNVIFEIDPFYWSRDEERAKLIPVLVPRSKH